MKIKPFFRFYDLWIGAYIDIPNRTIYICPVPMFGVKIQLAPKSDVTHYEMIEPMPAIRLYGGGKIKDISFDDKSRLLYGTLDEWKEFNRDDPF